VLVFWIASLWVWGLVLVGAAGESWPTSVGAGVLSGGLGLVVERPSPMVIDVYPTGSDAGREGFGLDAGGRAVAKGRARHTRPKMPRSDLVRGSVIGLSKTVSRNRTWHRHARHEGASDASRGERVHEP
jgi:hypothetical protein